MKKHFDEKYGMMVASEKCERVDSLEPWQEAQIRPWVDRAVSIGLCTDKADRKESEAAVSDCYALRSLARPNRFVWVDSPATIGFAASIAAFLMEHHDQVEESLGVDEKVPKNEWRLLFRTAVEKLVPPSIWDGWNRHDEIWRAICEACQPFPEGTEDPHAAARFKWLTVKEPPRQAKELGEAGKAVLNDVVAKFREAAAKHWNKYIGGQFWMPWVAYESFFRVVCGLDHKMAKEGAAFERAQGAHCWWWPHQQYFCMICDRPDVLARNEQDQFHREDGAAISFRDGWGIYSWKGVVVPQNVIMQPDAITVERIRAETNVEQARCMIERRGWHWFLQAFRER
jgi:hypothetical protein